MVRLTASSDSSEKIAPAPVSASTQEGEVALGSRRLMRPMPAASWSGRDAGHETTSVGRTTMARPGLRAKARNAGFSTPFHSSSARPRVSRNVVDP